MIEAIQIFFQALNNRELALLIWIFFAIIWCITYSKTRKPFFQLCKAFFAWKLTLSYLLMFTYITCVIFALKLINIWNVDHITLTVLWSICVAFVMLFNFQKANEPGFFKKSIKDNVKWLVFLEFFTNIYVFNFWIEFIIVPVAGIIGGMKALTEGDKEYEIVDKFLNFILIVAGLVLLIFSSYKVVTNFKNFATTENLEDFYMPILLSILFIPFVYIAALIAAYEMHFTKLQFFVPDKAVLRYAKFRTMLSIKFNLAKLNRWSDYINKNWRFKHREEVKEAVAAFKQVTSFTNPKNEDIL